MILQKTDWSEQKCKNQTWHNKPMRNSSFLRIFHFPTADKQIEGKIMNPTAESRPLVSEKFHHICQSVKTAFSFAESSND